MKYQYIWYLLTVVGLALIIYVPSQFGYESDHPSLNVEADFPDAYFKNVKYYANENRYESSIYHLEKAINSIRRIETDMDDESIDLLERAILKLETVKHELLDDSLNQKGMYHSFEYALNTLALTELKVSEMYAETNQRDFARMAIKHAKLHMRNAMLFENSLWFDEVNHLEIEKHVFYELDSLVENNSISPVELTKKINSIIAEMDQLVSMK